MTSLLDNIDNSLQTAETENPAASNKSSGIFSRINRFRKESPILFYAVILSVVTLVIVAIILIIKRIKKNADSSDTPAETRETFVATDSFTDEYDYINKYMEISMGGEGASFKSSDFKTYK